MLEWTRGVAVIAMIVGCGGTAAPTGPATGGVESALAGQDNCPALGCGLNGAWLGENIPFRELDLGGQANHAGLKVGPFKQGGFGLKLDVRGDELIGVTPQKKLRGAELVGAVLTLTRNPRETYRLRIEAVKHTCFWTEKCAREQLDWIEECARAQSDRTEERARKRPDCPDPSDILPLYTITFTKDGDPSHKDENICSPTIGADRALGTIDGTVVVFRGDQYEDSGYLVRSDDKSRWFNIACAGTAISKLHLLRHTTAGSRDKPAGPPRITSLAQRQTLLRMLTGDYCGIGYPFTVNGHRLSYTFAQEWGPQVPSPFAETSNASIDALWNEHGATCLGTPRLSDRAPEAELIRRIQQQCRPRLGSGEVMTRPPQPGIGSAAQPEGVRQPRPHGEIPTRPPRCDPRSSAAAWDPSTLARTGSYAVSANPAPFNLAPLPPP
jgi:hypothetical protein